MAAPKITVYLDTVSPFAYMAYYLLRVGSPDACLRHTTALLIPSVA